MMGLTFSVGDPTPRFTISIDSARQLELVTLILYLV
jgi:hypothetical protein